MGGKLRTMKLPSITTKRAKGSADALPAPYRRDPITDAVLSPAKCELCERCWLDVMRGQCIYGGPYSGYVQKVLDA